MVARSLPVHCTSPDDLDVVDYFLHDATFDLADVSVDDDRTSKIRFEWPGASRRLSIPWRRPKKADTASEYLLMIRCVDHVEVHDPDALQTHTYAGLSLEGPHRLRLRSNFPGSVTFVVSGIDVTLHQA